MKPRHGWLWGKSSYKTKIVHKQKCKFFLHGYTSFWQQEFKCLSLLLSQFTFSTYIFKYIHSHHMFTNNEGKFVSVQLVLRTVCDYKRKVLINKIMGQQIGARSLEFKKLPVKCHVMLTSCYHGFSWNIQKTSCQMSCNADFLLSWLPLKQVLKMH